MTYEEILEKYGLSARGQTDSQQNNTQTQTSTTEKNYEDILKKYGLTAQNSNQQQQVSAPAVTTSHVPGSRLTAKELREMGVENPTLLARYLREGKVSENDILSRVQAGQKVEANRIDVKDPYLQYYTAENRLADMDKVTQIAGDYENIAKDMQLLTSRGGYISTGEIDALLNRTKELSNQMKDAERIVSTNSRYYEDPDSMASYVKGMMSNLKYAEELLNEMRTHYGYYKDEAQYNEFAKDKKEVYATQREAALAYNEEDALKEIEEMKKNVGLVRAGDNPMTNIETYAVRNADGSINWEATADTGLFTEAAYDKDGKPAGVKPLSAHQLKTRYEQAASSPYTMDHVAYTNAINAAESAHKDRVWLKKDYQYLDLMELPDFAVKSAKGREKATENGDEPSGRRTDEMYKIEDDIYYYLYEEEGEDAADEFVKHLKKKLKERRGEDTARWLASRRFKGAASAIYGFATGAVDAVRDVGEVFTDLDNAVYDYANQELQSGGYLTSGQKTAHRASMSIGRQVPQVILNYATKGTGAGRAFQALSSYGAAEQEARAMGMNKAQARTYGILTSAGEAAIGAVSDKLLGAVGVSGSKMDAKIATIKKAWKRVGARLATRIASEELEEMTELFALEPVVESIVTFQDYDLPQAEAIVETAIITAISAGLMDAPGSIAGEIKYQRNNKNGTAAGGRAPVSTAATISDADTVAPPTGGDPVADTPDVTPSPMDVYESTLAMGTNAAADPVAAATTAFTQNGTVTDKQVQDILNSTAALDYLREQTGIPIKGTAEERSDAVRQAIAKLAQQTNAEPETTNADVSTPATDVEAVESMARPSMPDVDTGVRNRNVETPVVNTVSETAADSTETETTSPTESVGAAPSVISDAGTDIGTVKTGDRETATGRSAIYSNTYENASGEGTRTVGEMAKAADPNIDKYKKVTEKESVESAVDRTGDPEKVNASYNELINKTGWTGEDNDTAFFALNYFRKTGEIDKLVTLARRQREEGTRGAQLTQSFAKYTRMNATDCVLDVVEQVDSLKESDVPRRFYKGVGFEQWKTDVIKTANDIANQIDNIADGDVDGMKDIIRTLAQFRNTTAMLGYTSRLTKIAESALKDIDFETAKAVANAQLSHMSNDFVKRPAGQIIKTIRIHNMLASLVTFGRNIVSNAGTGMLDATSDSTVGRGLDALMSLATGKRTVGNDVRYAKDYLKGATKATKLAALCVELDIPLDSESRFQEGATRTYSPKGNPVTRFMGAFEKLMRYSLDVSDQFFSGGTNAAVKKSLENLGEKSNLSEDEISGIASNVGKRRTFKEDRMFTKASKGVKTGLNKIGTGNIGVGDLMMPFVGTTSNVTQTAIDYSTLGIGGFADMFKIMRDVKNGKYKDGFKVTKNGETISLAEAQRQAVTTAGRGLTGAGLIAGFTALAAKGIIGVYDDEDKDKRDLEQSSNLSGAQLNIDAAIRLFKGESTEWREGDWTVSVDFLEPANAQMYLGYQLSQDESVADMIKSYPGKAATSIFQAILDMPVMQGVSDLNDVLTKTQSTIDDEESTVGNKAEEVGGVLLGNTASGFIPAWLRQIAQYNDPYYRDTTGDSAGERALNQVIAQIPGLSKTLPEKYDGLGKVQRRYEEGDEVSGFLNTFVLPGKVKKVSTTEVTDYLDDLYNRTGNVSFYPSSVAPGSFQLDGEKISINGKENTEKYQSTYGNKVNELYSELISNDVFQSLSDDQQVEILNSAKKYAVQVAKASVSDYSEVPSYIRDRPDGMTEADAIFANAITGNFESPLRSLTESWKKGKNNETAVADLEGAWTNFQNMSPEMQEAVISEGGRVKDYITARNNGMTAEEFVGTYRVEYTMGNAFDSLVDRWKKGESNTAAAEDLEKAWEHYSGLSQKARNSLDNELTGRQKYYITARKNGISAEVFSNLYGKYYNLNNDSGKTAKEKASAWSLDLERARASGKITTAQRDLLKNEMYFSNSFRAKTERFDGFVEKGIPAETASYVDDLLNDLIPEAGKTDVSDIQRIETVANADRYLTESQQQAAMEEILPEKYYAKYQAILKLGMDTDDYAKSYRIYLEEADKGGQGVKARTIEEIQKALRITEDDAKKIYEIYKPPSNKK
jgi:hypothetical protein